MVPLPCKRAFFRNLPPLPRRHWSSQLYLSVRIFRLPLSSPASVPRAHRAGASLFVSGRSNTDRCQARYRLRLPPSGFYAPIYLPNRIPPLSFLDPCAATVRFHHLRVCVHHSHVSFTQAVISWTAIASPFANLRIRCPCSENHGLQSSGPGSPETISRSMDRGEPILSHFDYKLRPA